MRHALVLCACVLLFGCGGCLRRSPKELGVPSSGPPEMGSPQALLERIELASRGKGELASCFSVRWRSEIQALVASMSEFSEARERAAVLVAARLGTADADSLRALGPDLASLSPLPSGPVDWSRVRVSIEGDRAEVSGPGFESVRLVKEKAEGGQKSEWRADLDERDVRGVGELRRSVQAVRRAMQEIENGVQTGEIGRANFAAARDRAVALALLSE